MFFRLASVAETNRVMATDDKTVKTGKRKSSVAVEQKTTDQKFEVS